jgi:uncharacterized protein (TIGR02186 family)
MKTLCAIVLALAAAAASKPVTGSVPGPAPEEDIVAGLSSDLISITSSFTGADLVIFGAIESPDAFEGAKDRDLVIVVRGPKVNVTVRRKDRVAGVWVNADSATITGAPGYYKVVSTRALDVIARPEILSRRQIGIANLGFPRPARADAQSFVDALVRQKTRERLYGEDPAGIAVTGAALFQARISMPANVPVGNYTVEAYLFRNGQDVTSYSLPLTVDKAGIERRLFTFAHDYAAWYGAAAILIALLLGALSAFVFRERG